MASVKFQENLINLQSNLLNFAYMLTSNRDDAYDLLQDTTIKALDNEDKYAEGTNFKGWVFTIMRNIFINNYRRTVRNATVVDTTDNLYLLNLGQGVRRRVARRELRRSGNHKGYQRVPGRIPHPLLDACGRLQIQRNSRAHRPASPELSRAEYSPPARSSRSVSRLPIISFSYILISSFYTTPYKIYR